MKIGLRGIQGWLAVLVAASALGGRAAQAQAPVTESELEVFLGLNPPSGFHTGDLSNLGNGPVTSGSAIVQSFTVEAGATLTFDYNFLTNAPSIDSSPLSAVDPFAFITVPSLATLADNGFNFAPPMMAAPSATGYALQTGYQTETITFATAGTYNLGFGVVNVTTDANSSALLLGNMTLTSGGIATSLLGSGDLGGFSAMGDASVVTSSFGIAPPSGTYQALLRTAAVPEPSSVVLLVLGGLGAAVGFRRRITGIAR